MSNCLNLGRLSACECVADIFHIPLELHLRLQQQELCPHGQHNGADAQRILTRFLEQVGRRQLHRWRGRQFLPLFKTMAISNCTEKTRSSAGSCNKAKGSQHTGLFGRPNLIGCRRHVCNVVFVPPVGMQRGRGGNVVWMAEDGDGHGHIFLSRALVHPHPGAKVGE